MHGTAVFLLYETELFQLHTVFGILNYAWQHVTQGVHLLSFFTGDCRTQVLNFRFSQEKCRKNNKAGFFVLFIGLQISLDIFLKDVAKVKGARKHKI